MSQHPLLTVLIGALVLGAALFIGVETLAENQRKANADALVSDAIRLADDVQSWKQRPAAFDGGADVVNWTGLSFGHLGYDVGGHGCASNEYGNEHGCFALSGLESEVAVISACNVESGNRVRIYVSGTGADDVSTVISRDGC